MIFAQGHYFPLILHKPLTRVNAIQSATLRTVPVVPTLNKMQTKIFCCMQIRRFYIMITGYIRNNRSVNTDYTITTKENPNKYLKSLQQRHDKAAQSADYSCPVILGKVGLHTAKSETQLPLFEQLSGTFKLTTLSNHCCQDTLGFLDCLTKPQDTQVRSVNGFEKSKAAST